LIDFVHKYTNNIFPAMRRLSKFMNQWGNLTKVLQCSADFLIFSKHCNFQIYTGEYLHSVADCMVLYSSITMSITLVYI